MKQTQDLGRLDWTVAGYAPMVWQWGASMETGIASVPEVPPAPARVPGSVQGALRDAGILPDWNVALNARACEWVENRHWVYRAKLPDEWFAEGETFRVHCEGLDYCGVVRFNNQEVGTFDNAHVPLVLEVTEHARKSGNLLEIVFECAPRWLGQIGYTSQITDWKPRFNYTWDWVPRLVQIGVHAPVTLEVVSGAEIEHLDVTTDATLDPVAGLLSVRGSVTGGDSLEFTLAEATGDSVREATADPQTLADEGIRWDDLPVELWQPNGEGEQPLYQLTCRLLEGGKEHDRREWTVGFKHVEWQGCVGAPPEADPWICVVNGTPVFLQGINWSPILPNFADATEDDYRRLIELYRDFGCNCFRVWGGVTLEKQCFFDLCDECGILVMHDFPLSSSGIDNWPPEDPQVIDDMAEIAASYIDRRRHHVSLFAWCGGNELQGGLDGSKQGVGKPVDATHPMLRRQQQVVEERDPGRRFLPTSPTGPRFGASAEDFGKGLHWDVHGPWNIAGDVEQFACDYWANHDALFLSEAGMPGASPADIIREFAGDLDTMPATVDRPLWRRTSWWIDWPEFVREHDREPETLEEYVEWSQQRQAIALTAAVGSCKKRFPGCGGILLWMGHDCFPCTANTAIIDFHGRPKPAALALKEIWQAPAGNE